MAGKVGNGEGSIRKRPGESRWEARYVDAEGKRRSLYGKTRQEALRRLADTLRSREQGLPTLSDRQTVAQYLASWLDKVRHEVEASSFGRYDNEVRLRLICIGPGDPGVYAWGGMAPRLSGFVCLWQNRSGVP
jgi:integrase